MNAMRYLLLLFVCVTCQVSAQTIKIYDGSLNGQPIDTNNLVVAVEPGDTLSGSITIQTYHQWDDNNIIPCAMTWGT